MSPELAIYVLKEAIYTAMIIALPMLLAGLVVGLVISIFQSVTQVNEMTLTFIPKIIAVILTLVMLLPWIANKLLAFTLHMFELMPGVS
ncbi:MAG: flagellar biosynthesis protein FliQ [Candidatus Delongbacteria bacterium]|nr:flagellar biosynthesis protein FliQ [Candidatus Delongbacteria bacterium]